MSKCDDDEISPYKEEDYTKITFIPDFKKFHMSGLDQDIIGNKISPLISQKIIKFSLDFKKIKKKLNIIK